MQFGFAVTFDYLCPFARNFCEHVLTGLQDGADWDVTFTAYSLSQGHVEDGETDVWDAEQPSTVPGLLALQAGLVVRDHLPERFPDVHRKLFAARHDHGRDLKDPQVVRSVLRTAGVEPADVFDVIDRSDALKAVRADHERTVARNVWGVPTVVAQDRAVFVRLLQRPEDDAGTVRARVERIVGMVGDMPELHEFKQVELAA